MHSVTLPECPRYIAPPPTQLDLDFADLAIIDLSKTHSPKGRAELAAQPRDTLRTNGFVYAINHGYTQAQRDRIFDIADVPFTGVPPQERTMYSSENEKVGYYAGYKARRYWNVDTENNVFDEIEHYASAHPHPKALRPFLPELVASIATWRLRVIALSVELPEETLVEKHTSEGQGETSSMRTEEEEERSKNVWLKGHTYIGSVSTLWSQPVGGLQILSPDGKWRWVRHIDNALARDTVMEFFTGGFYKPTIHRVVRPPHDQSAYDRLGAFYFAMADDDVTLLPLADSPVLQRAGIKRRCSDEEAPLARACAAVEEGTDDLVWRVALTRGSENNTEVVGGWEWHT
ncbi:hypothetical protein V8E55_008786 [Tylopilus felleus]